MTIEVFKTWSLKIKPSIWFLRVVPLTNLRSNIHFELFLFTLIPACLGVGISGPVLQRIERVLCLGLVAERTLGWSYCQRSSAAEKVPLSPHQRRGLQRYGSGKKFSRVEAGWGGGEGALFSFGSSVCMCVPKGMMFAPFWSGICC